jgi:hypothetical protein
MSTLALANKYILLFLRFLGSREVVVIRRVFSRVAPIPFIVRTVAILVLVTTVVGLVGLNFSFLLLFGALWDCAQWLRLGLDFRVRLRTGMLDVRGKLVGIFFIVRQLEWLVRSSGPKRAAC